MSIGHVVLHAIEPVCTECEVAEHFLGWKFSLGLTFSKATFFGRQNLSGANFFRKTVVSSAGSKTSFLWGPFGDTLGTFGDSLDTFGPPTLGTLPLGTFWGPFGDPSFGYPSFGDTLGTFGQSHNPKIGKLCV